MAIMLHTFPTRTLINNEYSSVRKLLNITLSVPKTYYEYILRQHIISVCIYK